MKDKIEIIVREALEQLGVEANTVVVERPADMSHGDYSTNVALAYAKVAGISPRELAEKLIQKIHGVKNDDVASIEIAGVGFINFRLSDEYLAQALQDAVVQGERWGRNESLKGKKVIIEYTDPNPFKEFHIGHLMSNAIGESISRIVEASGAETKRACYQGDVGMHVAKTIFGIKWLLDHTKDTGETKRFFSEEVSFTEKVNFLGNMYVLGSKMFEDENTYEFSSLDKKQDSFKEINKKVYERTDSKINELYDWGRKISLDYFETIYKRLGTKFDYYFFESKTGEFGKQIVLDNPTIFEKSDNAIVYKGDEEKGLHTRVFVNSEGLPTYEAKELGLAKIKYDTYSYDTSIVVTGNEVNAYFRVLLNAMSKVFPNLATKTIHISHGMLRLPTGKMSSRTGDVITADALISDTKEKALAKISKELFSEKEQDELAEKVAIGAIKYSILRQASGKDIIFDFEQSLSFEGDSGPYLQYTYARTRSLLEKAGEKKIDALGVHEGTNTLHKFVLRFPETVFRANEEREPHHIATYLIELAREFNSFYGGNMILDGSVAEPYKLALVKAVSQTMKNGLGLLGVLAPERM